METVQIQLANLTNPNNKIKYQIQIQLIFLTNDRFNRWSKYQIQMTTKIFLQMIDLTDDPNTKFKYMNTPKVQMMNTPM
jgi:hypothetical protein